MSVASRMTESAPWSAGGERARLDEVAQWYDSRKGLNREVIKQAARCVLARARGGRALELGCAMGVMTEELVGRFSELDIVEGSEVYAAKARTLAPPSGRVHHCLFEEFRPGREYDTIVMSWILEHIGAPQELLERARGWLAPQGEIHIVVPNAESLHRRVGLSMGLLHRLDQLNETDLAVGHRRVYTWDRLANEVASAGLGLVRMDGILLKPLPSALMEPWPPQLRAAFFELSSLAPRLCSEIYAVCGHTNHANATNPADGVR